jgi:hypothetical protein
LPDGDCAAATVPIDSIIRKAARVDEHLGVGANDLDTSSKIFTTAAATIEMKSPKLRELDCDT